MFCLLYIIKLYFVVVVSPPYSIYVGEDKHESKCISDSFM